MNETRARWLGSVPLLAALPPDRLQHLADHGTARRVRRGIDVALADVAPSLFLVERGRIALSAPASPGIFAVLARGDAFNEPALLDIDLIYRATALEDAVIVALPAGLLRPDDGGIGRVAASMLAERTRTLVALTAELQSADAATRVAARMCMLAERHATQVGDAEFALPRSFSHEVLAACVGATRETVSRAVATFRHNGWMRSVAGRSVITDLPALRARGALHPAG